MHFLKIKYCIIINLEILVYFIHIEKMLRTQLALLNVQLPSVL